MNQSKHQSEFPDSSALRHKFGPRQETRLEIIGASYGDRDASPIWNKIKGLGAVGVVSVVAGASLFGAFKMSAWSHDAISKKALSKKPYKVFEVHTGSGMAEAVQIEGDILNANPGLARSSELATDTAQFVKEQVDAQAQKHITPVIVRVPELEVGTQHIPTGTASH